MPGESDSFSKCLNSDSLWENTHKNMSWSETGPAGNQTCLYLSMCSGEREDLRTDMLEQSSAGGAEEETLQTVASRETNTREPKKNLIFFSFNSFTFSSSSSSSFFPVSTALLPLYLWYLSFSVWPDGSSSLPLLLTVHPCSPVSVVVVFAVSVLWGSAVCYLISEQLVSTRLLCR